MNTKPSPKLAHLLVTVGIGLVIGVPLLRSLPMLETAGLGSFFLFGVVLLAVGYGMQIRHIKITFTTSLYKAEKWLVIGAFVLPTVATLAGDLAGQAQFGANANGGLGISIVVPGIIAGIAAAAICGLANLVYILTHGRVSSLRVLWWIGYGILWLLVAIVSYLGFSIAFSLRDPSTE